MNNQQKLTKLIEIAVENGWRKKCSLHSISVDLENKVIVIKLNDFSSGDILKSTYFNLQLKEVLFDHNFAKAIWGDGEEPFHKLEDKSIKTWQHHLQQAVISDDPLQYYWDNK